MRFKIDLPTEYLVTSIKFNFTSIDALKLIYNIEAINSFSPIPFQLLRPLPSQKIVSIDPQLKSLSINLFSFAKSILIYHQPIA